MRFFDAGKLTAPFRAFFAGLGARCTALQVMPVAFFPAGVADLGANQCDFLRPIRLPGQFMFGERTGIRADHAYLDTTGHFWLVFKQTFVGAKFACFDAFLAGLDARIGILVVHKYMDYN
jgi:hypothetical protein